MAWRRQAAASAPACYAASWRRGSTCYLPVAPCHAMPVLLPSLLTVTYSLTLHRAAGAATWRADLLRGIGRWRRRIRAKDERRAVRRAQNGDESCDAQRCGAAVA